MKTVIKALLLVSAVALAPSSFAASRSATFQVSFTVVESCKVQADARQQTVQCELATPYAISQQAAAQAAQPAQPQASSATNADIKVVTITF